MLGEAAKTVRSRDPEDSLMFPGGVVAYGVRR